MDIPIFNLDLSNPSDQVYKWNRDHTSGTDMIHSNQVTIVLHVDGTFTGLSENCLTFTEWEYINKKGIYKGNYVKCDNIQLIPMKYAISSINSSYTEGL